MVRDVVADLVDRLFAGDTLPLVQHLIADHKLTDEEIDPQTTLNQLKSKRKREVMNSDHVLSLLAMQTLELSVVIVLVWIAAANGLRRRPHLAYALWMVVLVKAVMPPVWSCPTGVFSWVLCVLQLSAALHSAIAADFSAPPMSHEAAPPVAATVPATHSRVTPSASPAAAASPPLQGMRSATVILLGWLTGSAL